MKAVKIIAAAIFAFCSAIGLSQTAYACVATSANNFCHATFDMNNFTSSTYKNTALGFDPVTGANPNAPDYGSATGMTYLLDSTGFGAISMSAQKNVTNRITWTVTQGGAFSFDWLISGQSSQGAKSYIIIDGGTPILLGTGIGPTTNVFGHYSLSLTAGQTISFMHIGTTLNKTNSSTLQISTFMGVPEINGGILPLGLLLLGLLYLTFKSIRNKDGISAEVST